MDWAERLDRDGFAVVPDVVAPAIVATLIAALDTQGTGPTIRQRGGRTYAIRELLRAVPETPAGHPPGIRRQCTTRKRRMARIAGAGRPLAKTESRS
jgi:hypothetical protein